MPAPGASDFSADKTLDRLVGALAAPFDAVLALARSPAWHELITALERTRAALAIAGLPREDVEPTAADAPVSAASMLNRLAAQLRAELFTAANRIASERTSARYHLRLPLVPSDHPDANVVALVDALGCQLVLDEYRGAARLSLYHGAATRPGLCLSTTPHGVVVELDLEALGALSQRLSQVLELMTGDTVPDVVASMVWTSATGKVRAYFERKANLRVVARLEIEEALVMSGHGDDLDVSVTMAATPSALAFDADGADGTLALRLSAPMFRGTFSDREASAVVPFVLEVPGLGAELHCHRQQSEYGLRGITLGSGPVRLLHGQTEVARLELNAADGRCVDLGLARGAKGFQIRLSPKLALELTTRLGSIRGALDKDFPESLLQDRLTLVAQGGREVTLEALDPTERSKGGVVVRDGRISLRSDTARAPLVVEVGAMLRSRPMDAPRADESHAWLRMLEVVPAS